jgi:hypothetical protein
MSIIPLFFPGEQLSIMHACSDRRNSNNAANLFPDLAIRLQLENLMYASNDPASPEYNTIKVPLS